MIPGLLDLEIFDKETGVIVAEAAVDIDNKVVILRDQPADTIPNGGSISITQIIEFAVGQATDPLTASIIQSGEIGGDGIYEHLVQDESITTKFRADLFAASELANLIQFEREWSFDTTNEGFEPGQIQRFVSSQAGIDVEGVVRSVQLKIEANNGVEDRITAKVNVATQVIDQMEFLDLLYRRVFRPSKEPPIKIEAT